jgi:diguanylate cyclase (GGDEF)-like protein
MNPMTSLADDLARLRMDVRYHRERRDLYRAKVDEPHAVSPMRLHELEQAYELAAEALAVAEEEPGTPPRVGRAGPCRPDDGDGAEMRDAVARTRDETATERDRVAEVRDRLAEAHEEQTHDTDHAAAMQRAAAALDREHALRDRRLAAADREHAAAVLTAAGVDDLTGALRRGVGLAAVDRQIERAHRTSGRLVLAFVDVDGLKQVNDSSGHAAGDRLLRHTAESIASHLRPYDVVVRVGGDEFVCSLDGIGIAGVRERFERVSADLAAGATAGSISVGLAKLKDGDSLDDLLLRADLALLATRGAGSRRSRFSRRSPKPRHQYDRRNVESCE